MTVSLKIVPRPLVELDADLYVDGSAGCVGDRSLFERVAADVVGRTGKLAQGGLKIVITIWNRRSLQAGKTRNGYAR